MLAGPRNMPVEKLVRHAIAGTEAGRTDSRPGLSRVLGIAGRIAPDFIFNQISEAAPA